MKKSHLPIIGLLLAAVLFTGCRNTSETTTYYTPAGAVDRIVQSKSELPTTGKAVDMQSDVNALAASIIDAKTGNFSPYLDLGFFKLRYNSFPAVAGQPYFIQHDEYTTSWWNWIAFFSTDKKDAKANLLQRTTMWIGTIPEAGKALTVQTKTGPGVRISGNGFESEAIKVTMEAADPAK